MELKNNIKEYRKKKRLTQEDLASRVGVSRQTIISIERYRYKPSLELGMKIKTTVLKGDSFSVDIKEQRAAVQSLQDVNAELAARIATLDQRLDAAKREASRARTAAAAKPKKKAVDGDIIKFP